MDVERLLQILPKCLPREQPDIDNLPDHIKIIDVMAMQFAIDINRAKQYQAEIVEILADWPREGWGEPVARLEEGPSYIAVGSVLGEQRAAFLLFAVGQALGFWTVITPKTLGIEGDDATRLAGMGMIMIDGFHPTAPTS